MKVDFGAHLPFYLQHEECERISNFTCRRRTTLRRHAKQAGRTGHSRRPSAKAPVRTGVPAAGAASATYAPGGAPPQLLTCVQFTRFSWL